MPSSSSRHGLEPCDENSHGPVFSGPVVKFAAFPRPGNQCTVCGHVSILFHSSRQYAFLKFLLAPGSEPGRGDSGKLDRGPAFRGPESDGSDKQNQEIQLSVTCVVTVGVQKAMGAERISGQGVREGFAENVIFELGLKDE